ncbi:hypothetical protein ACWFR5_16615 [Streptomyces sp. NPDC055092]
MVSVFVFVGAEVAVGGVPAAGVVAGEPAKTVLRQVRASPKSWARWRVSRFREAWKLSQAALSALVPTAPIDRVPELVAEVGEGLGSLLRFKLLKRQMDGRANFDLLRRRILLSP